MDLSEVLKRLLSGPEGYANQSATLGNLGEPRENVTGDTLRAAVPGKDWMQGDMQLAETPGPNNLSKVQQMIRELIAQRQGLAGGMHIPDAISPANKGVTLHDLWRDQSPRPDGMVSQGLKPYPHEAEGTKFLEVPRSDIADAYGKKIYGLEGNDANHISITKPDGTPRTDFQFNQLGMRESPGSPKDWDWGQSIIGGSEINKQILWNYLKSSLGAPRP